MRRIPLHAALILLTATAATTATTATATDLTIEKTLWGFDGSIRNEAFNPVSVLVRNPAAEPFDGALTLRRDVHGKATGARLVRSLYLGPFASKWVQFHPFVFSPGETWRLSWKGCRQRLKLAPRRSGPPATMFLTPADSIFTRKRLPSLPEELFPPSASLTSGLHALVVDHSTSLSPSQKTALIDWIKAGGVLHVLKDGSGVWPTFTGPLSPLNAASDRMAMGDGLVVKHDADADEADAAFLVKRGFPAAAVLPRDETPLIYEDFTESRFRKLKGLVKSDHNWVLIYLLVVVYLILIGPVNYLLGRKTLNYKRPILFFLGVALGFSLLFSCIGRRGYGESTIVHDLTLAHRLDDDEYDVRQWFNVFVTSGDYYKITHPGDHHYYSSCQRYESVNGIAVNGKNGYFHVDVPLFSSRPLYHRAKMTGPTFALEILENDFKSTPPKLRIGVKGNFPAAAAAEAFRLVRKNRVYSMTRQGDVLTLSPGHAKTLDEYLKNWRDVHLQHGPFINADIGIDATYDAMLPPLMAEALGGHRLLGERTLRMFPGRPEGTLFILTETPPDFHCASEPLDNHQGRTLYQVNLDI